MADRSTAEFTHALQEVVKERGTDFRYPTNESDPEGQWHDGNLAVYRTRDGSQGACIIGTALFYVLGPDEAPGFKENAGAYVLMGRLGWDDETATAAACAQIHQDWGFTWGDCLIVYVEALQMYRRKQNLDLASIYSEVIQHLVVKHGVEKRWVNRRLLDA
jgi:hypothetical protein